MIENVFREYNKQLHGAVLENMGKDILKGITSNQVYGYGLSVSSKLNKRTRVYLSWKRLRKQFNK